MRYLIYTITFFLAIGCGGLSGLKGTDQNNLNGEAKYLITITTIWNNTNFPTNFPSNRHFSSFIGMTHNNSVRLFQENEKATTGVINVAETGNNITLKSEINNFINNNKAEFLFNGGGILTSSTTKSFFISANSNHHYFSIISTVAPSPDWFVGVDSLNLLDNGKWLTNKDINLTVYDAGSDSGLTFISNNNPTNPKDNIKKLTSTAKNTDFSSGKHRTTEKYIATINIKKTN